MGGFDFKGQSRTTGRFPSGIHQLASRNQPVVRVSNVEGVCQSWNPHEKSSISRCTPSVAFTFAAFNSSG